MTPRTALRGVATRLLPKPAGYVDHFDIDRVAGWAVSRDGSGRPALLSLRIDGQHVMNIAADLPRDDVSRLGRAPLRCGFDVPLPSRVRDGLAHVVEVRMGEGGARLRGGRLQVTAGLAGRGATAPQSPQTLEGVAWFDRPGAALAGWATGCTEVSVVVQLRSVPFAWRIVAV